MKNNLNHQKSFKMKKSPNESPKNSKSITREKSKVEDKKSPKDVKIKMPKMIEFDKNATPCMENACGLLCTFSLCKRGHASSDSVTSSLTKIGTRKCVRIGPKGSTCEKNKQVLKMKKRNGCKYLP